MTSGVATRSPIVVLGVAIAALTLDPQLAHGQVWSEDDVARMAAERPAEVRSALARAELAWARASTEGLAANPWIDWERQETFAPNAQAQDLVRAILPLDLSGRRSARRAIAEVEAELARADAARTRADAVESALLAFYGVLAAERRLRSYEETQRAIDEARRVVGAREAAGEASGYASARLALEAELARSRLEEARVVASSRRAMLAAALGVRPPARFAGELSVSSAPPLAPLIRSAVAQRPELSALRSAHAAALRAESAAAWAWIPRLDLSAGYNRQQGADEASVGHGYAFRVGVEIPLFDHGQRERAESAAARSAVFIERRAVEDRVAAEVRAQHARLAGLIAERARFEASVAEPIAVLARSAESGYREGERSVAELVDAQRALADVRERGIALELATRSADVALRRASGALR